MEAAWRHTDTLIFQSRYQEILLLVQDDPLEDLMRVSWTGGVKNKSGTRRVGLSSQRAAVLQTTGTC